jgi:glutathionylspermidine synthase
MILDRIQSHPRADWQRIVESQGLLFHTAETQHYWDESACYRFSSSEIDYLEKVTHELDDMCLKAVDYVIEQRLFDRFAIPPSFTEYLVNSWERDEFTVYGRFDLAYDGSNPPKLLEYNADTPTALLEAAVIQWFWLQDVWPHLDQFNGIHDRLIEAWASQKGHLPQPVYFASASDSLEHLMTVTYLRDTAVQAGIDTDCIEMSQIGWDSSRRCFTDLREQTLGAVFKLYPWEWMLAEEFGPHLTEAATRWLEAPWKMILSNKAILTVLWELFPDSPYLLEASAEQLAGSFVRKPVQAREGANIVMVENGQTILETGGDYPGPYVFQRRYPLRSFAGNYPIIGSWMVNGYACGMGIREDTTPITQNTSRFVPHVLG